MTSLQIGKAINALLSDDNAVAAAVGSKIFPIVSKEGTQYPFIVYQRFGVTPDYCKDGLTGETSNVSVIVAAASYSQSVEIADAVRSALEGKTISFAGGLTVQRIDLAGADEEFIDDAYVQQLTFNIYT